MKLFVDDLRKCPEDWHLARTVTEAIRCLATMDFDEVSLDHDIAYECPRKPSISFSAETFEPVAHYIACMQELFELRHSGEFPIKVTFHTSNFDAGRKMASILGMNYQPRFYPTQFIESCCSCEDEKSLCQYCKDYYELCGSYPGKHGEKQ